MALVNERKLNHMMIRKLRQIGTATIMALLASLLLLQPAQVIAQEVRCVPPEEENPDVYMSEQQRACFDSGILNYDLQDLNVPEGDDSGGGPTNGPLEGCSGAQQAYNFLKEQGGGLSDEHIAGILGNLSVESSFNPRASNSGNYLGIAQWDSGGRFATLQSWVAANPGPNGNTDPYDLGNQLRFMWYEANQRGNIQGLSQQPDYEHAAWYWGRYFEVAIIGGSTSDTPLTNVQALDDRIADAATILNNISSGNWDC